jgi:hypothetical protein
MLDNATGVILCRFLRVDHPFGSRRTADAYVRPNLQRPIAAIDIIEAPERGYEMFNS